ncbi:hypothetical protein [Micropruina sonneratiae]|uniref:hypothetical protein n=1 Tax=Micropruina sonneratiae TaxID=2986940 RepID=UPI002227A5F5|nr:hypothetical protein [Micropruina sp. KQZ13P-5]MCW3156896.1 hypothetical protein [Micropruina sp. KQZ13P-5]
MTNMCMASDAGGGGGDPVSGDGLIYPAALPAKSADLDIEAITSAASGLRSMGRTVDKKTDEIKKTWSGLSACYEAPEQGQVYALMDSPATASEDVKTTFVKAAGHLDTYAEALELIKPKLSDFETRAQAFRDEVIGGVWVDAHEASDAHVGTYIAAGWNAITGQDQDRKLVPWNEDTDTVDKNTAFVEEIGAIYAEVSQAASTCATSINGLTSLPLEERTVEPIPEEAFYNPESPMPWGSPTEEDRNCVESVGNGAYQFGAGTLNGLGSLISYNPETGDWGDWGHAGQAWMGTGNVLLSLAVTGLGTTAFSMVMHSTGNGDNPVVKWLDERQQVSATVVSGLVGIDLNADDPFHKWKEDGVSTFTESFLNVGTMFIPGAGQVGAALKVGSLGSKLARITGAVADFAVPGGSWVIKGGLHTIPVLRNVLKFGDEVPVNALDNVADAAAGAGRGPTFNPAAAIDDVVPDVPPVTPDTRPVSNDAFGGDTPPSTPDVDPAPTRPVNTAPEVATPDVDPGPARPANNAPELPEATPQGREPEPAATTPEGQPDTHPVDSNPEAAADGRLQTEPQADADPRPEPDADARPDADPKPVTDANGNEFTDGRSHRPGDPENTFRDVNGRLHGENGTFTAETQPDVDRPVEKGEPGTPTDHPVSPADQAAHDARIETRNQAEVSLQQANARLQRLVESTGIDPSVLKGSKRDVAMRISELIADNKLTVKEGRSLTNAVVHDNVARNMLRNISETIGDKAAAAVARMRGEITLIGSGGAGAGRFDQVTLVDQTPPVLRIYEAKGGNSQLGSRIVDGVEAQQGSTRYVNDLLQVDPRLAQSLNDFVTNPRTADSALAEAIRTGTLRIEYDLVQALPGGRIKVTPFVLDSSALKLPDF